MFLSCLLEIQIFQNMFDCMLKYDISTFNEIISVMSNYTLVPVKRKNSLSVSSVYWLVMIVKYSIFNLLETLFICKYLTVLPFQMIHTAQAKRLEKLCFLYLYDYLHCRFPLMHQNYEEKCGVIYLFTWKRNNWKQHFVLFYL